MKFPIEWHVSGVCNMRLGLARAESRLEQAQNDVDLLRERIAFTEKQIAEAQRLGMTGFDPGRFLVKRGEKRP